MTIKALPKRIKINGTYFQVRVQPDLRDDDGRLLNGSTDIDHTTITLAENLSLDGQWHYLRHEWAHVAYYFLGIHFPDDEAEERACDALAGLVAGLRL